MEDFRQFRYRCKYLETSMVDILENLANAVSLSKFWHFKFVLGDDVSLALVSQNQNPRTSSFRHSFSPRIMIIIYNTRKFLLSDIPSKTTTGALFVDCSIHLNKHESECVWPLSCCPDCRRRLCAAPSCDAPPPPHDEASTALGQ